MLELSMHILDIAENSVTAGAHRVTISVNEDTDHNTLTIDISDDGRGMDDAFLEKALDPFVTTKPGKRTGMGLSLFSQAARQCGGTFHIDTSPGKGTHIHATFLLDHPDRQPLGDMIETLTVLVVGQPDIDLTYSYIHCGAGFTWDSDCIACELVDLPRYHPDVAAFVRTSLENKYTALLQHAAQSK